MGKKIKVVLLSGILVLIFCLLFFKKIYYKKNNIGNNINIKSLDENYILDINDFNATIELIVNSNKNTNKYVIKQEVKDNICKQEVIEPENIRGVKIIYDNGKLTVCNSKLSLSKIYENYPYIAENIIFLNDFIQEYKIAKQEKKSNIEENEEYVILTIENNKNIKKLYVQKNSRKPYKIVVQDNNKKDVFYILYKEINIENV